ncbi:hypothetical protein AAFF_G00421760 [Aldrovandia affinis]|uniref:Uncharacterized protein n=1 Tax=Aldrovandia affinis TaxID=143900 RepID=A0AAD7SA46_9TELE|nr:hypothetical protein AAFF_G00421760 [Aldrovandia affinis]
MVSSGLFVDKMGDYGAGFLMVGVALNVFLLLLHQMNRKKAVTSKPGKSPARQKKVGRDWEEGQRKLGKGSEEQKTGVEDCEEQGGDRDDGGED